MTLPARWMTGTAAVLLFFTGCGGTSTGLPVKGTVTFFYGVALVNQALDEGKGDQLTTEGGRCLYDTWGRMTIRDGAGDTIATVKLADGINRVSGCETSFDVSVPERDFYTFEIGDGDDMESETFSRQELEAGDPVKITVI